jgi:hypothetical protein
MASTEMPIADRKAASVSQRPCPSVIIGLPPIYGLSRARIRESVTIHSRWARHFCWAAGARCLYLQLSLTLRQGFRRGFVPLRLSPAHRHGGCKQGYSKNPQHVLFLPSLVLGKETLSR